MVFEHASQNRGSINLGMTEGEDIDVEAPELLKTCS